LPAPAEGISLADKQTVTRLLMHSGAGIGELNRVRKQLSRIKGGRLAASTKAGIIISLIISDVIGDPLDVIASGPTVADPSTPEGALFVLKLHDPNRLEVPESVWTFLENKAQEAHETSFPAERVHNHIIGNNNLALSAAAKRAEELGYDVESLGSGNADEARTVGVKLAQLARARFMKPRETPVCLLSGGEPVVHLVPTALPRKGGRNQEVALSALVELWDHGLEKIVVLSGGTDGEDGPTDAAGAFVDALVQSSAMEQHLDPKSFLAINNSYPFFERAGGLLKTGPTHTNVMDLRVVLVANG
jgi:hydroxypyruvate reductase